MSQMVGGNLAQDRGLLSVGIGRRVDCPWAQDGSCGWMHAHTSSAFMICMNTMYTPGICLVYNCIHIKFRSRSRWNAGYAIHFRSRSRWSAGYALYAQCRSRSTWGAGYATLQHTLLIIMFVAFCSSNKLKLHFRFLCCASLNAAVHGPMCWLSMHIGVVLWLSFGSPNANTAIDVHRAICWTSWLHCVRGWRIRHGTMQLPTSAGMGRGCSGNDLATSPSRSRSRSGAPDAPGSFNRASCGGRFGIGRFASCQRASAIGSSDCVFSERDNLVSNNSAKNQYWDGVAVAPITGIAKTHCAMDGSHQLLHEQRFADRAAHRANGHAPIGTLGRSLLLCVVATATASTGTAGTTIGRWTLVKQARSFQAELAMKGFPWIDQWTSSGFNDAIRWMLSSRQGFNDAIRRMLSPRQVHGLRSRICRVEAVKYRIFILRNCASTLFSRALSFYMAWGK